MKLKKLSFLGQIRIYVGLIIVGLFLILLQKIGILSFATNFVQDLTLPIQISFFETYRKIGDVVQTAAEIGSLRTHNSSLERENALLEAENAKLRKFEAEDISLRNQLGTPLENLKIKASANPIGIGGLGTKSVLLINKGTSDGVKNSDLVVVKNILIGEIVETSPRVSSVQLLADPDTKIPAKSENGSEGIVEGQFGSSVELDNVVQDDTLNSGELVLTSGKGAYPRNLVLGKIGKVTKQDKDYFQKAEVLPLLPISSLELVYIVEKIK